MLDSIDYKVKREIVEVENSIISESKRDQSQSGQIPMDKKQKSKIFRDLKPEDIKKKSSEIFTYSRNLVAILAIFRPIIKTPFELYLETDSDNSLSNESLQLEHFQSQIQPKHQRNSSATGLKYMATTRGSHHDKMIPLVPELKLIPSNKIKEDPEKKYTNYYQKDHINSSREHLN